MQATYIEKLLLQSDGQETQFIMNQRRTCYNGIYPYKIFPQKGLREISFAPITIFYVFQWRERNEILCGSHHRKCSLSVR